MLGFLFVFCGYVVGCFFVVVFGGLECIYFICLIIMQSNMFSDLFV